MCLLHIHVGVYARVCGVQYRICYRLYVCLSVGMYVHTSLVGPTVPHEINAISNNQTQFEEISYIDIIFYYSYMCIAYGQ